MEENTAQKIDKFFKKFKHQTYKKGEILIRADDNPAGIFYLKLGQVRQYAISKKGIEVVVNVFKPDAFFPMSWAINNTQNVYFFEAMTDLEVWRAPRNKVLDFVKKNPDVLYDLLGRVFRGTDGLLMRMTYLMAGNAYSKLIMELLMYTKRMEMNINNSPVQLRISEKDIAAEIGMTRETVSRELKILKEKGLLSFKKNILTIKNMHSLEQELEDGV